jgi:hypothetical protein
MMAIYMGAILGGPEHIDRAFDRHKRAIARRAHALQSDHINSCDGVLHIVFQFPGTLFRPDFTGIQIGRFIKKENLLEVRVAVPADFLSADDFPQRYVALLKQAIAEGKKVFDKKTIPFSLEDHLALVDRSLEAVVEAK